MTELIQKVYGVNRGVVEQNDLDRTKYHKLSDVPDLARMAPVGASGKRHGVVVPRASENGGSRGYNPHLPVTVLIDPELTGGQVSINYSLLTKDDVAQAWKEAEASGTDEVHVHATLLLAERSRQKELERRAPKKAAPALETAAPASASPASRTEARPIDSRVTEPESTMAKMKQVVFELPGPFGTFRAYYTDVARTDDFLVLVHERGSSQTVWFPPSPSEEDAGEPMKIRAMVYDENDRPDTAFVVYPTGARFTYKGTEFCLLTIHQERSMRGGDHDGKD